MDWVNDQFTIDKFGIATCDWHKGVHTTFEKKTERKVNKRESIYENEGRQENHKAV